MKVLTDAEKLEIAVSLLDKQGFQEYEEQCYNLETDCERNGFYNVPAECENRECSECKIVKANMRLIGCPYAE